jgi:molybdate transport system substrate-binding protein
VPDISTVEAFKKALLAAKSVAYVDPATGATSGTHFAKMLEKMGITADMKPKSLLKPGGYVVELVAKGEAELGVHQITEILPVKGVKLVGPIPADVNLVSTYTGVLVAGASPEAKAFLDFATSPEAKAAVEHAGFQWPR